MLELDDLSRILEKHTPKKHPMRRSVQRAAVSIILLKGSGATIEVLMIRRADREYDPWSGHMAFPGGKMDLADSNVYRAAIRETQEEIGLDLDQDATAVGRLDDILSRSHDGLKKMVVTPFVFTLTERPAVALNHEVAEVVWIPMNFLMNLENRGTMRAVRNGQEHDLPKYDFKRRRVWGLSLGILDDLMGLLNHRH